MTALLKTLARSGIVISNPFHPRPRYARPRIGDACKDFVRVADDMRVIDKDFRRVAARETFDESPYKR
ncbi:hypothetical protein [Acidovorax sp. NCPPB 4044]|uniref:hypothetical protein n=1 Tax=Acidovorax sp. NCPPB 4044 TaxID=2940490 RepID=UPI0023032169|nr:hypothetical protein [Acidovorax sp. NCPPB 4044]MDA8522012.1 hypothetical protein [Acidovorax sp. NCPPB 4044]